VKPNFFRTRIKFCGLTRAGDVRLASELGVDAVGFVFSHQSKRRVEPEEARAMRTALAPFVDSVALFRNNPQEEVRDIVRHVRPTLLQFHGDEDDSFCRGFGVPYIKAVAMGGDDGQATAKPLRARYPNAADLRRGGGAEAARPSTGRASRRTRASHGCSQVGWHPKTFSMP
jgi:phosphoribosylanthranilate isomerase